MLYWKNTVINKSLTKFRLVKLYIINLLTLTNINLVPSFSVRPVEGGLTFIAVDAFSVVLTILADPTAFVPPVDIQRLMLLVDFSIVLAFRGVVVAVTSYTTKTLFQWV